MWEFALVAVSGFVAGLLNSVAGGGTFFTLPVLILIGIPPTVANATATLAVLPGYVSSAWAFRKDMKAEGVLSLRHILIISCFGSLLGALLLIITTGDAFLWIIPWLLLLATILFAISPLLTKLIQKYKTGGLGPIVSGAAIFIVSVYGGYFNGGLGIMLLATFGLLGFTDLHGMNGLKNVLSALLSFVSAGAFMLAGLIAWEQALPMAICATIGGYVGARYSRKIVRTDLLRVFIVLVGAGMTILFFAQNLSQA